MRHSATSALRGNLLTRSNLFKMKLVDNPNCLFCSEETPDTPSHRLYQCPNSKAIWDMVNTYLAELRDWMSSNGDSQFFIDHRLYISEKEVFLNFYEEHPNSVICPSVLIVKYYIQKITSINVKSTLFDMPIKIQSTFMHLLNVCWLNKTLSWILQGVFMWKD